MGKQTVGAEIQVYLYLILLPLDIYSNITPPFVSSLDERNFWTIRKVTQISIKQDTGTRSNRDAYLVFSVDLVHLPDYAFWTNRVTSYFEKLKENPAWEDLLFWLQIILGSGGIPSMHWGLDPAPPLVVRITWHMVAKNINHWPKLCLRAVMIPRP